MCIIWFVKKKNNNMYLIDRSILNKKFLTIQTGWCLGSISDAFLNRTRARFAVEYLYSIRARD